MTTRWLVLALLVGCSGTAGRDPGAIDPAVDPSDAVPSGGPGAGPGLIAPSDGGIAYDTRCAAPRVRIPSRGMTVETCSGTLAARTFENAICSCTDVTFAGALTTRSFDSRSGMANDAFGAPVGVNGGLVSAGLVDIGGTFAAGGDGQLGAGSTNLTIAGDAFFGADVLANRFEIARDAWIDGTLFPAVELGRIGRDLHLSLDAHDFPGGFGAPTVGGATTREAFDVSAPCACADDEILDVGALVDDAKTNNDNAAIGLSASILGDGFGSNVDLTLPCGRYYVTGVEAFESIHIRIEGRAALFVDGSIIGGSALDVELASGAELDLFVKGDILAFGEQRFGDPARPAAMRMFVGGAGGLTSDNVIAIAGDAAFSANLYAPRADLLVSGTAEIRGSLFARSIGHAGDLRVLYDRAVIAAGETCDAPVGSCDPARNTCPNGQACMGGVCAACGTDADCGSPLVCYPDGTCGALLF